MNDPRAEQTGIINELLSHIVKLVLKEANQNTLDNFTHYSMHGHCYQKPINGGNAADNQIVNNVMGSMIGLRNTSTQVSMFLIHQLGTANRKYKIVNGVIVKLFKHYGRKTYKYTWQESDHWNRWK